jgi:multidrug resistance efflux pump
MISPGASRRSSRWKSGRASRATSTEIKFKAGAIVKKGDPLFVIDPRPYQADFDRAAAQLEQAQAQLKLAEIELNRAKELRATKVIALPSSTRKRRPPSKLPLRCAQRGGEEFRDVESRIYANSFADRRAHQR